MKVLPTALLTTTMLLGATAAGAATLGTVEYDTFVHTSTNYRADLGGASPTIADATVIWNDYNGATTLPDGLPAGYDIHIPATFIGDRNTATADAFDDRYLFTLDPATMDGNGAANADATLNLIIGVNTGVDNVTFAFFKATDSGATVGGPIAQQTGDGNLQVAGLQAGTDYLLRVTGNLRADNPDTAADESTNVGQYKIVLGLTPVPVPPAVLLLLTALGALFGFRRLPRREKETAAA